MNKPKYLLLCCFCLSLIIAAGSDTYAFYSAESSLAANSFSLSKIYSVEFDPGEGNGTMPSISIASTGTAFLPRCSFTKEGYHFKCWRNESNRDMIPDTAGGDTLISSDTQIKLTALWTPNTYTVHFEDDKATDTGTLPADISCSYGISVSMPAYTADYPDHLFLGWSLEADGTGRLLSPLAPIYNLSSENEATVTLYAVWEDESDGIIETGWNKALDSDADGNGIPDRNELNPGDKCLKDPSVKNHSSKSVYAYMTVSVPTVEAGLSSDSSAGLCDIAELDITPHWKLIKSYPAGSDSQKSQYIYRYDKPLKAHGSTEANPYHSLRHADRSTDLMSGFQIKAFSSCPDISDSIDIDALLIEACISEAEADEAAAKEFHLGG